MGVPLMPPLPNPQGLLLKAHQALIQAKDEREVVAASALVAERSSLVRLLYLTLAEEGGALGFQVVASWRENGAWEDDPLLHQPLPAAHCGILARLEAEEEPGFYCEQVGAVGLDTCLLVGKAASAAGFKLYGAVTGEGDLRWHAVLLITWDTPCVFTPEHKYLGAVLVEPLAMVVSNLRLRSAMVKLNAQLRELDQQKDAFLHSVSHELRTPLSGITTLTEAMLMTPEGFLGDEVREDIGFIHQSGQRLLEIISDILDMAAIRAGVMRLERRPCSPERLVTESLRVARALPLSKGRTLESHLEPGLPSIWVDCGRIRQVMLNLLSNALKFSEKGHIEVCAWREGQWVLFGVRDQGMGVPLEQQTRIFEPFRRVDTEAGRRAGGTGLGLPISKRLVELHGGQLGLSSQPGEGSCVVFSVPIVGREGTADEHPVCGGYAHSRACHEQGCAAVGRGAVGGLHGRRGAADGVP